MSLRLYTLLISPFLLITSVLVLPIQGLTPIVMMLFSIIPFVLLKPKNFQKEILLAFFVVFVFCLFLAVSQLFVSLFGYTPPYGIPVISGVYSSSPFQLATLTQSIYLLPCLIVFLLFKRIDISSSLLAIKISVLVLCVYGLYEVFFFSLFGFSGDFLSNRSFNDGAQTGSAFQSLSFAGITIQRLKSLTLEPSTFAYSVIPFLSIFVFSRKLMLSCLVLLSLALTVSGTFLLGVAVVFMVLLSHRIKNIIFSGTINIWFLFFFLVFIFFSCALVVLFVDVFDELYRFFLLKFSGVSDSGVTRLNHFLDPFNYWKKLDLPLKMFGLGFGIVRPTNMLMLLLINVGLVGLTVYVIVFLYPLFYLQKSDFDMGLRGALLSYLLMSLVSVPEFSYLTGWVLLGVAYKKINRRDIPSLRCRRLY